MHAANVCLLSAVLLARITFQARTVEMHRPHAIRSRFSEASHTDSLLLLNTLNPQSKWEQSEDKPAVLLTAGISILALTTASSIVNAVDSIPIIGGLVELLGIAVTGWFVYRYGIVTEDRCVWLLVLVVWQGWAECCVKLARCRGGDICCH